MKHTIQALVENKFGVLARIASLFSARGYNISSLAVGETQDPAVSCMTIVVDAEDERVLEQIKKQLNKLIDVITVADFTHKDYIDRDLCLIRLAKSKESDEIVHRLAKEGFLKVTDSNGKYYLLEVCTDRRQEDEIIKELKKIGIEELVRTGRIAIRKE